MKKGIFLIIVILLLVVGWSVGWFWIEGKVNSEIAKAENRFEQAGGNIECANQASSGYPFRISISCDEFSIQRGATGFRSSGLKTVAQAYQPNKLLLEVASPGQVVQPNGVPLDMEWSSLRGNLKAGLQGLNAISLQSKDLVVKPQADQMPMTVSDFQYHERLEGENNLDIAIVMTDVKDALLGGFGMQDFDMRGEVKLLNAHKEFSQGRDLRKLIRARELEADIQRVHIEMASGGGVKISGPITFFPEGVISGQLEIDVSEIDKLIELATQSNPEGEKQIKQLSQIAQLFSKPDENGVQKFNILIDKNTLQLGLMPAGTLPRLY